MIVSCSLRCLYYLIFGMLLLANPFVALDSCAAPIYVIKQSDGSLKFTTSAPPSGISAKVFTAKKSNFSWYHAGRTRGRQVGGRLFKTEFREILRACAARHALPESLVRAVIHVESAFNPKAISPKGAMGLMQLMPQTAKALGVKKPFDPADNVAGGTKHLASLIERYNKNIKLALAAYNAGEEAVNRYGGVPPFSETQNYVREVTRLFGLYAKRS